MFIGRLLVALSLSVTAGTAIAASPDGDDLVDGIALYRSAPFLGSMFAENKAGQLEEWRLTSKDGDHEAVFSFTEHALLAGGRYNGETFLGFVYDADIAPLHELPVAEQWQSDIAFRVGDAEKARGVVRVQFRGTHPHKVGECEYSVWEVDVTTELSIAPVSTFRKFYSPNLGLVLGSIKLDPKGQPISAVAYDTIFLR